MLGRDNTAAPAASRHVFDRDALYISRFAAEVTDPQDTTLPASAIVWRSDGVVIGRGTSFSRSDLPSAIAKVTIHVTAPPRSPKLTS